MIHSYSFITIIPAIILLIALIALKKKSLIGVSGILLFVIYIGSTFTAALTDPVKWFPYFHESSYTLDVMIIYGILLLVCLWPTVKINEAPENVHSFKPPWLIFLMWLMIFGNTYAIFYQLPYALQASAIDADEFRREMDQNLVFLLHSSPATTLAVFFGTFYMLHIALAFQSSIVGGSTLRTALLWITSTANVVSGATFATRDASVFYLFALVFNYLYFRNSLDKKKRKVVRNISAIFILFMAANTAYISIERFANPNGNSLSWGTLGYFASQPYTFSEAVNVHENFYKGDLRLPAIKMIFNDFTLPKVERVQNYETMFGTFLKDFYSEGGWLFLIIGSIFILFVFSSSISNNKNYALSSFIMQSLYIQFMFTGIFYFVLGSKQGNIYTIILFFIFIICRNAEQNNIKLKNTIINRKNKI